MIETAVFCMALNIYHEARGEPVQGQFAVAQVTMNRVRANGFGNTVCEVVTKRKHFSWTNNNLTPVYQRGKFIGYRLKEAVVPKDMHAWSRAVKIAKVVIKGKTYDYTNGALFYHKKGAKAWWKPKSEHVVASVGNHVFYRYDKSTVSYNIKHNGFKKGVSNG